MPQKVWGCLMENKLSIKSPRQQRALLALLEKPISIKDLGPLIGALNPRQIIFELRNQGFAEIILTRRFSVIDQDGKPCLPGEYYIPEQFKPTIEQALKESHAQAGERRSGIIKKTHNRDNSRRMK